MSQTADYHEPVDPPHEDARDPRRGVAADRTPPPSSPLAYAKAAEIIARRSRSGHGPPARDRLPQRVLPRTRRNRPPHLEEGRPSGQERQEREQSKQETREEAEQEPDGTPGAHTSVPSERQELHRNPEELPLTPRDGDLKRDVVLRDLRSSFNKVESAHLPQPDSADTPLGKQILRELDRTETRPYGAMDFSFIRVSMREFEMVNEWRPLLAKHDGLRGFAQLVIHRKRDEENADKGYVPVPKDTIRGAFGLKPQKSGKQLSSLSLLWAYKCFVDPDLEWSKYTEGRCRRITQHSTPEEIMEEATSFFHDRRGRKGVLFMKGDVSAPTENDLRTECFEKMDGKRRTVEEATISPPEKAQHMTDYLNGLTREARSTRGRSIFHSLADNVQEGVDVLMDVAEEGPEVYDKGIRQSITQLRRFQDMPQMLYQAANFTPRPTPVGGNHLVGVDSMALPLLLGDRHVALDLSKAQLAMFATVAAERYGQDMTTTQEALEDHLDSSTDFDMWESMQEATKLPDTGTAEYAVKRATYSAVYGAKRNTIKHNASKEIAGRSAHSYPAREKVEGLLDHPVISDVLSARTNARRQISYHDRNDPHTKDAFGRVLDRRDFRDGDEDALEKEQRQVEGDDTSGNMRKGSKSLLAYIVQSLEVKTMWPIFEAAINERERDEDDRWRILLYKYDEVILWVSDKRETERWKKEAMNLVDRQTNHLDIETRLDVEYTP